MTKKEQYILKEDLPEGIRRVILNRPDKRNALSNSLRQELFSSLEEADNDPTVRVIIISGAGTCSSSGYDYLQMFRLNFLIILVKQMVFGQGMWLKVLLRFGTCLNLS